MATHQFPCLTILFKRSKYCLHKIKHITFNPAKQSISFYETIENRMTNFLILFLIRLRLWESLYLSEYNVAPRTWSLITGHVIVCWLLQNAQNLQQNAIPTLSDHPVLQRYNDKNISSSACNLLHLVEEFCSNKLLPLTQEFWNNHVSFVVNYIENSYKPVLLRQLTYGFYSF